MKITEKQALDIRSKVSKMVSSHLEFADQRLLKKFGPEDREAVIEAILHYAGIGVKETVDIINRGKLG